MNVLIIDSHVLFRQGLASLLNNDSNFEVIGEVATIEAALLEITGHQPDLIIIDPAIPEWDPVDSVRAIMAASSTARVLVLTTAVSDHLLFGSILAGVSGCLLKDSPISKVQAALYALYRGEPAISRSMVARILDEFRKVSSRYSLANGVLEQLTEREIEILGQLAHNASNEEIAARLVISENTVKVHVHNIIKKLNLRNRREAAMLAQQTWLVESVRPAT